ncbi:MAG: DUF4126 domain-containing protein [Planctomycetes bacterium]|nr:DUF4126 domain-containing protein [Planctomycetota bacterium]
MEIVLSIALGIGLSAACGFRVFVPFLVISIASLSGHLELAEGFTWIGTWPALIAFAVATALEIGAYYVPWLDNLLDSIATPVAVIAGVLVAAACITDMSPLLKWVLAVIVGGGAAGAVQGLTVVTRAASTATTGGIGNPVVSSVEAGSSVVMSGLAVLLPLAAAVIFIALMALLAKKLLARKPRPAVA